MVRISRTAWAGGITLGVLSGAMLHRWRRPGKGRARFVYVSQAKSGAQTLHLAELVASPFGRGLTARTVATLASVPGETGVGGVPEWFATLLPSPDNAYVAVLSVQLGLDFIDLNVAVYGMIDGHLAARFNEHRFSAIDRATCHSASFDAFLAAEAAMGVPQATLDGYDWGVMLEGAEGANLPSPTLTWIDAATLVATFVFEVLANGAVPLGPDDFSFRVPAGSGVGASVPVDCYTGPLTTPAHPADRLSLAPIGGKYPSAIHYAGAPLRFTGGAVPGLSVYRNAVMVAGYTG